MAHRPMYCTDDDGDDCTKFDDRVSTVTDGKSKIIKFHTLIYLRFELDSLLYILMAWKSCFTNMEWMVGFSQI